MAVAGSHAMRVGVALASSRRNTEQSSIANTTELDTDAVVSALGELLPVARVNSGCGRAIIDRTGNSEVLRTLASESLGNVDSCVTLPEVISH
jgi:hypothetical protein